MVQAHILIAAREPGDAAVTVRNFRKLAKSYRKLLALVRAGDAAGAQQHWRSHMDVVARSLLPAQLRSATVLDMFSS